MNVRHDSTLALFLDGLRKYTSSFEAEMSYRDRFLELLESPEAFDRTHLPGHITGSAFIVSKDFTHTLLVHHAKLNRWLQPGGHADGDTNVIRVALREANEETGLLNLSLVVPEIFDLDIHTIPERKDFPKHDHYDVRYLVSGSVTEQVIVSEESFDVRWIALEQLDGYNDEPSILRLRDKVNEMRTAWTGDQGD